MWSSGEAVWKDRGDGGDLEVQPALDLDLMLDSHWFAVASDLKWVLEGSLLKAVVDRISTTTSDY